MCQAEGVHSLSQERDRWVCKEGLVGSKTNVVGVEEVEDQRQVMKKLLQGAREDAGRYLPSSLRRVEEDFYKFQSNDN